VQTTPSNFQYDTGYQVLSPDNAVLSPGLTFAAEQNVVVNQLVQDEFGNWFQVTQSSPQSELYQPPPPAYDDAQFQSTQFISHC
jgi:hypothetical protein